MKKTTYQIPEIRDEKDNIIQSGTYGKNSPLCNDTNDGVLDYINNNLEYLKGAQDIAIENMTTEYATKNELKRASDALTASLAQKISADAQSITTKALTVTGETTVPTANVGNKSETIANTEFVQNTVANLVDSAPETLNTLNELARALNNDPNFATTITNLIAEKESKQDAGVAHTELSQKIDDSIAQAHHYIQRNTAYKVGDIAYSPNLPSYLYLECTTAGITGATEPDMSTVSGGVIVNDGTAQFSVKTVCAKEYVDTVNTIVSEMKEKYIFRFDMFPKAQITRSSAQGVAVYNPVPQGYKRLGVTVYCSGTPISFLPDLAFNGGDIKDTMYLWAQGIFTDEELDQIWNKIVALEIFTIFVKKE